MKRVHLALFLALVWNIAASSAPGANPGQQTPSLLEYTVTHRIPYLLYLPPGYEDQDAWPLILFLHGAGERGDDLEKVKIHGPPKLISEGQEFEFIVVSPQCAAEKRWDAESLSRLLQEIESQYKVDPDRIYVTGLSMGGFGTWSLALANPEKFAAIAPICGGGDRQRIRRLRNLPTWVFHGAKDSVVPLERSQELVDALQALDAPVKFTVYPEAEHDSWTETYNNPELYKWFLQHERRTGTD